MQFYFHHVNRTHAMNRRDLSHRGGQLYDLHKFRHEVRSTCQRSKQNFLSKNSEEFLLSWLAAFYSVASLIRLKFQIFFWNSKSEILNCFYRQTTTVAFYYPSVFCFLKNQKKVSMFSFVYWDTQFYLLFILFISK